jgi:hypothetical protein
MVATIAAVDDENGLQIKAEIICDSVSTIGVRITTMVLTYPRYIHAELMTHRVFSRNAASSRAIPVKKLIRAVADHPVIPISWGSNKPGMQAGEDISGFKKWLANATWTGHRYFSLTCARILSNWCGVHKQHANRLLEAHSHIKVLVTSTKWANFIALRYHKDAQPEMRLLAKAISEALDMSYPIKLETGQWHLPFISSGDIAAVRGTLGNPNKGGQLPRDALQLISAARCARISFTTFDRKRPDTYGDLELGKMLVSQTPLHASPLEHQATPDISSNSMHLWGNFHGWIQYRKMSPGESALDKPYSKTPNRSELAALSEGGSTHQSGQPFTGAKDDAGDGKTHTAKLDEELKKLH